MPKLDLYALGARGVDLTNSVIHTEDGTFSSAQNATPDVRGEAGAVTKRDGLVAINSSALAGAIRGAVHVPLALGGSLAVAGSGGVSTVYVALDVSGADGYGWSKSTDAFTTFTEVTSNPALPIHITTTGNGWNHMQRAVVINNKMYYAAGGYTEYTDPPTIRVFDGVTDREFARLPPNPDVYPTRTVPRAIIMMLAVGAVIYISVYDGGTTSADAKGSVLSLDTTTGVFERLGSTFPTGKLPGALAWSLGRLWVGTNCYQESTTSLCYFIRPGIDTDWTADETFASATSSRVVAMVDFRGSLYAAVDRSLVSVASTIYVRSPTDGTWTTSETDASSFLTSLIVFKDNLYCTRYGQITSTTPEVRKFDGSTWTSVLTGQTALDLSLVTDGTTLYAFRYLGYSVYTSTDGTTWSSLKSASLNGVHPIVASFVALTVPG